MNEWHHDHLERSRQRYTEELLQFLSIPSVSSLSEHAGDVRRAAHWVVERLGAAGIENAEILEPGGHPCVYGEWLGAGEGKPTVLIYGHFDTQPADPVELWSSPPFEPTIRDGRVYARGSSDNKGNMLVPILAIEALLASQGSLPVNLKLFFEGEEEIGSPFLSAFMEAHKERLACDLVISADGMQSREETPTLVVGWKGLCSMQIDVRGPGVDLHSGIYGGAVQNPIHALAEILSSMRSAEGTILVEGFFDQVAPLTAAERAQFAEFPYDEGEYKRAVRVEGALFGEPGYSTHERAWARPTLEVNGIWGGFQGEGVKTVIPSEAHCKITCRLVPDQDPQQILAVMKAHIEANTPPGVSVSVSLSPATASAYVMPIDHPGNRAAHAVMEEIYGHAPHYIRQGGTLPVCGLFRDLLGVYTVIFAFALEDENAHAPDEFFRLSSFERGQLAYCRILETLGESESL